MNWLRISPVKHFWFTERFKIGKVAFSNIVVCLVFVEGRDVRVSNVSGKIWYGLTKETEWFC